MGPLFDKDFLTIVDLFHTLLPRLHRFSVPYQKPHAKHMQNTVDGCHGAVSRINGYIYF